MRIQLSLGSLLFVAALSAPVLAAEATTTPANTTAPQEQPNCIKDTGSHLPRKQGECVPASGQVLTREDLERSGATTTAEAIRKLSAAAR